MAYDNIAMDAGNDQKLKNSFCSNLLVLWMLQNAHIWDASDFLGTLLSTTNFMHRIYV